MPLGTLVSTCLLEHLFSILLGIYPGVELLAHGSPDCFPQWLHHLHSHQQCMRGFWFLISVWFCFKSNSEDDWQQSQAIKMERIRKRYNERIKGFGAADNVVSLLDEEESGRNPMSNKIKYFKHYHYQPTLPVATCSFVLLSPSWAACIFIFRDLN